jgi:ketosteroid isomerase-like protein
VETVERMYERWNADDLEGCLALLDPEFEMVPSGTFPDLDPVYQGNAGFRRFWNQFHRIWQSLTITIREVIDDGDRVVALWVFDGEGRDGIHVQREGAHVVTFRGGLAFRMVVHASWDSARAALGR